MNNQYKVGIYLRLSKEDKLDESQSITNQRIYIMDYLNKNNLSVTKEYVDDGVSGTIFNRQGWNELINDIENKIINMVVTKDTSRLGRNISQALYYSTEYFQEKNIRYVAINDNIDTFDNNQNTDMLLFKAFYNEMYVKDISMKIKATLISQKRNGHFMGGIPPFGYDKNIYNKHELVINKEQAIIVKKIYNLFIQGYSIHMIATKLTNDHIPIPSIMKRLKRGIKSQVYGIWQDTTIKEILTNPTYKGDLTQNKEYKISYKSNKRRKHKKEDWIIAPNKCPPIIDNKTFDLVQTIYNQNKHKQKKSHNYLLKGLLYCNECHHSIAINNHNCYCNNYKKYSKYHVCTPHKINYLLLEKEIINHLTKIFKDKINTSKLKEIILNHHSLIIEKNRIIQELKHTLKEKKLNNEYLVITYQDKLKGLINEEIYTKQTDIINNKLERLYEEINNLKVKLKKISERINNINETYVTKTLNNYLMLNDPKLLAHIINKIYIDENLNIKIFLKCNDK